MHRLRPERRGGVLALASNSRRPALQGRGEDAAGVVRSDGESGADGHKKICYVLDQTFQTSREFEPYGPAMYDVTKLKTVADCRLVMQRARQQNVPDVYDAVFRRMCQLVGSENDDPGDPLVRDFYETLAAYEQLLTEKNGRTQPAHRTRQKIANKGVYESLVEWTRGKAETDGFRILVEAGLPEYTGEYLVARYAKRFPADVVSLARERLGAHNIALPAVNPDSLDQSS